MSGGVEGSLVCLNGPSEESWKLQPPPVVIAGFDDDYGVWRWYLLNEAERVSFYSFELLR